MDHHTRVVRRPWRARPPTARCAVAATFVAAVILLAAACGSSGSPSSTGSGGSSSSGGSTNSPSSAVAFSGCMRSHGLTNFPDPGSDGTIPKESAQQLGVSSSQFDAAQRACQPSLPATGGSFDQQVQQCYLGGNCPPALVLHMLTVGRTFARCMRSHAVPNFPDPTLDSQGRPFFNVSAHDITLSEWHSSRMRAKADECSRVAGGGLATG